MAVYQFANGSTREISNIYQFANGSTRSIASRYQFANGSTKEVFSEAMKTPLYAIKDGKYVGGVNINGGINTYSGAHTTNYYYRENTSLKCFEIFMDGNNYDYWVDMNVQLPKNKFTKINMTGTLTRANYQTSSTSSVSFELSYCDFYNNGEPYRVASWGFETLNYNTSKTYNINAVKTNFDNQQASCAMTFYMRIGGGGTYRARQLLQIKNLWFSI